jgi:hypothetical protein
MKLILLCIDGLDYYLIKKWNFSLPYEQKITIPKELYEGNTPYTPHIWPSIFTGKIVRHPDTRSERSKTYFLSGIRYSIREILKSFNVSWRRKGWSLYSEKDYNKKQLHFEPTWELWKKCVEKTVLDEYYHFKHNIPSVSDGFLFTSIERYKEDYITFKELIYSLVRSKYDLAALYTHYIDSIGHTVLNEEDSNIKKLKLLYFEVFELAKYIIKNNVNVMIISDHGCIGDHTDYAYIGANYPIDATNILEIIHDIRKGII